MDKKYMKRAIELAILGTGCTNPNPLVGAVIVKNDKIISEGHHELCGSHHAEINALNNATEDVIGATMYVTLEPCSHHGKTPPCADAIVKSGMAKVVIGMMDPNPLVAGKGIKILKSNGIEVITGVMEKEVRKINEIFIKYITTKMPFCIMKTAMTLDGKIASKTGDSKWITNEKSRAYVHELRNRLSAIMVGVGTVLKDDPMLTTRLNKINSLDPIRIIVDSNARTPIDAKVFNNNSKADTIIACTENADKSKIEVFKKMGAKVIITQEINGRVDLIYLMKTLGEMKIDSVLLEGGGELNYSALESGIVDKVLIFIAPKIIGGSSCKTPIGGIGKDFMKEALRLKNISVKKFDDDIMIEGDVK